MWKGKAPAAVAADFSRQPHPRYGSPFTTHEGSVARVSLFILPQDFHGSYRNFIDFKKPVHLAGRSKKNMNTDFRDSASTTGDAVFRSLRAKLAREVSGSAMLSELLEKVNRMQECHDCPEDFKVRFDEFVVRAEEYLHVVRPFFPALVQFLGFQMEGKTEPQNLGGFGEADLTGEVA
jgi:hypothetical protein